MVGQLTVSTHKYIKVNQDRLTQAHKVLLCRQQEIKTTDNKEPPLFKTRDLMWMISKRKRKGKNVKLSSKCQVMESLAYYTVGTQTEDLLTL